MKPFRRLSIWPSLDRRASFKHATRRFEILAVLIVSSLIYAFVDPYFSASLTGFSLFICLAVGIAILTFGYDGMQVLVSRRFGIASAIKTYPLAIIVAIVFVAFSRLLNFRPGLLYGFVGAYTVLAVKIKPSTKQHGVSVLLSSIVIIIIALAAFYSRELIHSSGAIQENSWRQLVDIGLVCIFALCLEGVFFNLIPITFLDGARLLAWRKWVWVILTTTIAFLFYWIIINKGGDLIEAAREVEVQTMYGFTGFLLVLSLATWVFFRFRKRRLLAVENIREQPPTGGRADHFEIGRALNAISSQIMPTENILRLEDSLEDAGLRDIDERTNFHRHVKIPEIYPNGSGGVKRMNYCSNCGAKSLEGANFCPKCGAPVTMRIDTSPAPEEAQYQPARMNWFERHLNVTFFFGWLLIIGASISILVPTFAVGDTNPVFAWFVTALVLIVWTVLHIWITIWYLGKKHRSPAFFLLLVLTWLGVWILLGLKNKARSTLDAQRNQAAPSKVPYRNTPGDKLTFADHLEQGFQSLRSSWDVNSATNHFLKCLEQNPNSPEALLGLARCDIHESKYDEARQYLEKAAKVSPEMVDVGGWPGNSVSTWLGFTYLRAGFAGEAIASLQRAAELSSEHYLTHRFLGEAYLEGGYASEAIETFKKASQLNPSSEDPHMYLAAAYLALGNQTAADSEALLAKSKNPNLYPLSGEYLERVRKMVSNSEKAAIPKIQAPGTAGGPGVEAS